MRFFFCDPYVGTTHNSKSPMCIKCQIKVLQFFVVSWGFYKTLCRYCLKSLSCNDRCTCEIIMQKYKMFLIKRCIKNCFTNIQNVI